MNHFEWVIVDIAQIQPYVFSSNRLREILGGSYLVSKVTSYDGWAIQTLRAMLGDTSICGMGLNERRIEDSPDVRAEVIYAGGGNIVILMRGEGGGNQFIRKLSLEVLTNAPGLQIVAISNGFDWQEPADFFQSLEETWEKLGRLKHARAIEAPLGGMAVTRACPSTAMPAVEWGYSPDNSDRPEAISAETAAKRSIVEAANSRLRDSFLSVLGETYEFPYELDQLGRSKSDFSYIAVVHVDGDRVGDRIQKILSSCSDSPRNYIDTMRKFSHALDDAGTQALGMTLDRITNQLNSTSHTIIHKVEGQELLRIDLSRGNSGRWYLPVRPILYGGDDLTLVCDGRIALTLMTTYMHAFEKVTQSMPDGGGPLSASGGVVIVKSHYPFAQAYHLAERLAESAKDYRRQIEVKGGCLDWHFAQGSLYGDVDLIRKREYRVPAGNLTLRPVTLEVNPVHTPRAWTVETALTREFQGKEWFAQRNKQKGLRDALRGGPNVVKTFLTKYLEGRTLVDIEGGADYTSTGWQGEQCGYFDAIELSDWYIPL